MDHVVSDELEVATAEQVGDVGLLTREKVVDADDVVPHLDETVTEVAAEKTGTAGDKDAFDCCHGAGILP